MAGTKEGGLKMKATVLKKYGPDYYVQLGKRSKGYKRPGSGFASMTPKQRRECGRKGGLISTRKKPDEPEESV